MNNYSEQTILPADDFVIPGPGGNRSSRPRKGPGRGRRGGLTWLLKAMVYIVMFFFRPVIKLAMPVVIMLSMLGGATWWWYPATFEVAKGILFSQDSMSHVNNWTHQTIQLWENFPKVQDGLPAHNNIILPKQLEGKQPPLLAGEEMTTTLLFPVTQP